MKYKNYFAEFCHLYDLAYSDIINMITNAGVTIIDIPYDENDCCSETIEVRDLYYCSVSPIVVTRITLEGETIYITDNEGYVYEAKRCVEGTEITTLYDIVWRALSIEE